MENWPDCNRMDYNSYNGHYLHRQHNRHHGSRNQSFSSALLAAIYKSTEDEGGIVTDNMSSRSRVETINLPEAHNNRPMRNSRIERQWEENPWTNNEKFIRGRSAKMGVYNAEKDEAKALYSKHRKFQPSFQSNMSSAALSSFSYTSDSTSRRPYLSSDAEPLRRHASSIPTAKTGRNFHHVGCEDRACKSAIGGECSRDLHGKSSVGHGHFRSTEKPFIPADQHAKINSNFKTRKDPKLKPKQPISPGRKLANFLNSLFMPGGTKKPKLSSSSSVSDSNSYDSSERKTASVYSSSSSVQSRPCLRKTSGGSNNSSGMSQKSVTFYLTDSIVDKDTRPCRDECLHGLEKYPQITHPACSPYPQIAHPSADVYDHPLFSEGTKQHILEEERHGSAAAKEIIGKYQKANSIMATVAISGIDKPDEDEEDDDDDASCSSSELFELENLAAIDTNMNVYQAELPVYETTHFATNKAIAKGLML